MVFFKYGFAFLIGAGFGAAVAHRGQHHHHGHCWRRHWGHRWHEQDPAPASYDGYERERRGYGYVRPDTADNRDTEEREYRRSVKKSNKPAAAAAADAAAVTSDY